MEKYEILFNFKQNYILCIIHNVIIMIEKSVNTDNTSSYNFTIIHKNGAWHLEIMTLNLYKHVLYYLCLLCEQSVC